MYVDHFGNLISNVRCAGGGSARFKGMLLPLQAAYGHAANGEPIALVGSSGYLEVAITCGDAAAGLNAAVGASIEWLPAS